MTFDQATSGSPGCTVATDFELSELSFVVRGGEVVAAFVGSPDWTTPSGIHVGSSVADLQAALGSQLTTRPTIGGGGTEYDFTASSDGGAVSFLSFDGSTIGQIDAGEPADVIGVEDPCG